MLVLADIESDTKSRMDKSIDVLSKELSKTRTGRAHPSLLDSIMVPYYGQNTPISQVAGVTVGDSRTLVVTPWEKNMLSVVEKAIRDSDLGLNPISDGQCVRVPMPALTQERRQELIKHVRAEGEKAKVSIRNIRRDSNRQIEDLTQKKEISSDDERRGQDHVQKITDAHIKKVDELLSIKEKDLMEI